MSRLIFAALVSACVTSAAGAQRVPGRDLFDFPLGLLAEAAPFSSRMVGGLWNPAAAMSSDAGHAQFGFAGLTTPQEQGVRLQMLGAAVRVRPRTVATLTLAQASVSDIIRTESDPQSIGGELPYNTTVLSAGVSTTRRSVTLGAAARYRWASVDADRGGVFVFDVGGIVDRVAGTPLRVAASTFLLSPSRSKESATYFAAADAPLYRRDSNFVLRGGYSISRRERRAPLPIDSSSTVRENGSREDYVFVTTSYRQFDLSGGTARFTSHGMQDRRFRLGIGIRYAGYAAAIGREDGAGGIGASYQFLLTRAMP